MRKETPEDDGQTEEGAVLPYEPRSEDSAGETDLFLDLVPNQKWVGPRGQVYNAKQVKTLLDRVKFAATPKLALRCSGIDAETLKFWLKQGKDKNSPYRDFRVCFLRLLAESEAEILKGLYQIARHDRTAVREILEIRWPTRYRKKKDEEEPEPVRYVVLGDDAQEP